MNIVKFSFCVFFMNLGNVLPSKKFLPYEDLEEKIKYKRFLFQKNDVTSSKLDYFNFATRFEHYREDLNMQPDFF